MKDKLIIGSRGSKLALTQANWARDQLVRANPDLNIEIAVIKTTGDIKNDPLSVIGGKGVFTKELEEALLTNQIDLAVHSLKDLPTTIPESLMLAAICEREDPHDALVVTRTPLASLRMPAIRNLAGGVTIGTSSQRRLAQVKHLRPDIIIKELRGNVDTRLRKLDEGQFDALILAAAGLLRLAMGERISATIGKDEILPAVGQGALGIETRASDEKTIEIVSELEHRPTRVACTAERALLRALGGGCQLPIAAHAIVQNDGVTLEALVAAPDGSRVVRDAISGSSTNARAIGDDLAQRLLNQGASSLLNTFNH